METIHEGMWSVSVCVFVCVCDCMFIYVVCVCARCTCTRTGCFTVKENCIAIKSTFNQLIIVAKNPTDNSRGEKTF